MHVFLSFSINSPMSLANTLFLSLLAVLPFSVIDGDPLVPALIVFGDSNVDTGNNDNLPTFIKANFPPYGRDFVTHRPTGRFSNGKLVTDFVAESLGFSSFPPTYLSQEARGKNLLIGSNFGSGGSGLHDRISESYGTISLIRQVHYYKEYRTKVVNLVGQVKANDTLFNAIFLVSTGNADFISYFISPFLNRVIPPDEFTEILLTYYTNFIQNLYALGARKIQVTTVAPAGCLPLVITILGSGSNQCITIVNQAVTSFNKKLYRTSESLRNRLPGLRLMVLDIYQPFLDMIIRPAIHGFSESRRGCCGSGVSETSYLCNAQSVGTCSNATRYVFWDAVHQTEAANKIMADNLLAQGRPLLIP